MLNCKRKHICLVLSILLFSYIAAQAQIYEDFSDGDYLNNPEWTGTYENFSINKWHQLQTQAETSAVSFLSTPLSVNSAAEWHIKCRILGSTTQNNYFRFYLISTTENPQQGEGYFVQLGGRDKGISLQYQSDGKTQVLIANEESKNLLVEDDNNIELVVSLSDNGSFHMKSKLVDVDEAFVEEGRYTTKNIPENHYFSIFVSNTKERGSDFYVSEIWVEGEQKDWGSDTTHYSFSEDSNLIINEIMFDPDSAGQEYVEIFNRSEEYTSLAGISLTTKNDEGQFRKGNEFPEEAVIAPQDYAVLCYNVDSLIDRYPTATEQKAYSSSWARKLPNQGATLFLLDADSTILDSVSYSPKWHHPLLRATKGVALERISPELGSNNRYSWLSAAKDAGYATPCAENSQAERIDSDNETDQYIWLDKPSFSPNGDGYEDVCLIQYNLPENGYTANIRIFTPNGILLYSFEPNESLGQSGAIVWDGRTARGMTAEVGVYVIYCQFINTLTGKKISRELPIAISAR